MSQYPTGYPQPGGYPPPPQDSQQYGAPDSQQYGAPDSQQYGGYIPRPIQETSQPQIYPPNIPTSTFSDTVLPLLPQQSSNVINVDPSEEEKAQLHYGEVPAKQPRRFKTTKKVKLFRGNLVLDCPVPTKLLSEVPRKNDGEFKFMRYTPCTCDPNDFMDEGYTLRQQLYDPPRQTELFIVLTMYNEDEVLFARTFHGVEKNIDHLCSRGRSRTWGQNGWQKVVVCIVSDGRSKINPRTLSYLAAIGVYQDGVAKNQVNNKEVTAHLYEYTTQLSIGADMKFKKRDENSVPIQVLFCLKEKNAKKINSHRWFFNAFGRALNPQVCVLIDVGTKPGSTSIYHLWKAFDINPNLGGACGEIVAMKGRAGVNLLNPLVASQNFEYKMSNILDKPLESVFGYITVLPGAFSAYRFRALQNDIIQVDGKEVEVGPLKSYFLGETQHGGDADIFTANMYLAEDRILCFELVAKRGEAWVLQYVKSSYAETDVPDTVAELISQRRRWLNGSFFAGVYAICHTFSISRSDHTTFRKTLLYIEMFYQTYNLIFSWIALGNFYLAFYILGNSLTDDSVISGLWSKTAGDIIFNILRYVYITLLVVQFILAMGNRPQGSKWAYIISIIFFSGLMVYMLFAAVWLTYKGVDAELANLRANHTDLGGNISTAGAIFGNPTFSSIILSVMSTYGLYIVASLLFFDPWHMFNSLFQYLLLVPFYINILNVYAFCNVHDVSWGTKGDTAVVKHDLGSVTTSSDKSTAEVEVPVEAKDINALYQEAVDEIQRVHVEPDKPRSASEKQDDYYKTFRTNIVLAWIITNGALVAAITNSSSTLNSISTSTARANSYMQFVLWSVAGLAAFRFLGSCTYLLIRLFTGNI